MARQNFVGVVISHGKMNKTVKVRVQTQRYDTRVHKEIFGKKDYLVHDEGNLCTEGDLVRIESIPKISSRKYFAIAEVKLNEGQQFEKYEALAKERVARDDSERIEKFLARRKELDSIVTQVSDLQQLDKISRAFPSSGEAERAQLLEKIEEIKQKYGIPAWPSTEPVLEMKLSQDQKDLSVLENRVAHIKVILEKVMADEQKKAQILEAATKGKYGPVDTIKPQVQKNIVRKWILDPRNDVPVSL